MKKGSIIALVTKKKQSISQFATQV